MRVLPPSVSSLICFFLIATPSAVLANPVPAPGAAVVAAAQTNGSPTAPKIAPRQATARMGRRKVKKAEPLQKKDYSAFLCPESAVACPVVPMDGAITPESIGALDAGLNTLADWFTVGFECVELATELNQCGGCLALGAGHVFCFLSLVYQVAAGKEVGRVTSGGVRISQHGSQHKYHMAETDSRREDCSIIPNARATGCEDSKCRVYSCFDGFVVSPDRSQCVKKGSITPAIPVTAFSSDNAQAEAPQQQRVLAPDRTTRS